MTANTLYRIGRPAQNLVTGILLAGMVIIAIQNTVGQDLMLDYYLKHHSVELVARR